MKAYDTTRAVAAMELEQLLEAVRLAPSSFGLQPYRVVVVEDAALRGELRAASYGQAQITEASRLLVFAVETTIDEAYVRRVLAGQPEGRVATTLAAVGRMSTDARTAWATRQAYLALGFLLAAAAERRIDANPMEGFVAERYDALLGLEALGISSVVIAAIGHRSSEDRHQHFPKLRRPPSELVYRIGGAR